MFNIKGLNREDLVVVAMELDLNIEPDHRIVDIKGLIEKSCQFGKEFEFMRYFLNTTVSDGIE